jgi:hypothetical protein
MVDVIDEKYNRLGIGKFLLKHILYRKVRD